MSLFISSHLLGEVQLMCDRVAIINKGKTVAVGKVEELMGRMRPTVRWTVEPLGAARELLAAHGFPIVAVEQADPAAARTDVDIAADPAAARAGGAVASGDRVKGVVVAEMAADRVPEGARRLMEAGIRIYAIEPESPSLESLYLRLTEGEVID
jgi:ABC-2 type transport system ATP-binding protein